MAVRENAAVENLIATHSPLLDLIFPLRSSRTQSNESASDNDNNL